MNTTDDALEDSSKEGSTEAKADSSKEANKDAKEDSSNEGDTDAKEDSSKGENKDANTDSSKERNTDVKTDSSKEVNTDAKEDSSSEENKDAKADSLKVRNKDAKEDSLKKGDTDAKENLSKEESTDAKEDSSKEGNKDAKENLSKEGSTDAKEDSSKKADTDAKENLSKEGSTDAKEDSSKKGDTDAKENLSKEESTDAKEDSSKEGNKDAKESNKDTYENSSKKGDTDAKETDSDDRSDMHLISPINESETTNNSNQNTKFEHNNKDVSQNNCNNNIKKCINEKNPKTKASLELLSQYGASDDSSSDSCVDGDTESNDVKIQNIIDKSTLPNVLPTTMSASSSKPNNEDTVKVLNATREANDLLDKHIVAQHYREVLSDTESETAPDITSDTDEHLNAIALDEEDELCDANTNFYSEKYPPIEDLKITVDEAECIPYGKITNIVDNMVLVEPALESSLLDIDSVLFLEKGKKPLGLVFDVMGKVSSPLYCVRFNSNADIKNRNVTAGLDVYIAPKTEHTKIVILSSITKEKGCDASWEHDSETPAKYIEYSDDEDEKSKRKKKKKPKKKANEFTPASNDFNHNNRNNFHGGHIRPNLNLRPIRGRYPIQNESQNNNINYNYNYNNCNNNNWRPPPLLNAYQSSWHTHFSPFPNNHIAPGYQPSFTELHNRPILRNQQMFQQPYEFNVMQPNYSMMYQSRLPPPMLQYSENRPLEQGLIEPRTPQPARTTSSAPLTFADQ